MNKVSRTSEEEILNLRKIIVKIPYPVTNKANYVFDLVVMDLNSVYRAKYRAVIKRIQ